MPLRKPLPAKPRHLIRRRRLLCRVFDLSKVKRNVLHHQILRANRGYFIFDHMLDLTFHGNEEEDAKVQYENRVIDTNTSMGMTLVG